MMKDQRNSLEDTSVWQRIFLQSKANGAPYNGEQLPGCSWDWPKNTYFQRRLRYLRWSRSSDGFADLNRSADPMTV